MNSFSMTSLSVMINCSLFVSFARKFVNDTESQYFFLYSGCADMKARMKATITTQLFCFVISFIGLRTKNFSNSTLRIS